MRSEKKHGLLIKTIIYGCLSIALYFLLYFFNEEILERSREGGWNFIYPVAIAFIFSIVHGNFTGYIWELFGVKAKPMKK